ncbi:MULTISPECIES: M20 family metallopeptidase [Streptomyces]|uniref:Glutamate carboxypeptidase n=1 Tax=Streptomyces nymphaeiformis TaxID=2663842 RepID=A0A7W7TXA0_9ACTN|nr:M20 family metallopeptidase [Streptomyces nymphaeiformis]MBB4980771.1 glutamate carboxypeptidase [Streptomyces nymphaeiformis]
MSAPPRQQPLDEALLSLSHAHQARYLEDLAELVAIDSGSYSADGVNRVADLVRAHLERLDFSVERVPLPPAQGHRTGDVLIGRRRGRLAVADGGRRLLLAAHMDTVFDDGAAAERPFSLSGPLAHGPGVSDDKGGLVAGLAALEILASAGIEDYAELVFLATPDEEIGSPASRPVTRRAAEGAHYALALECARENGDLVIARKGVADFRLTVTGRAAHAGIEPERGANAALAAAHLVIAVQALNGTWEGVTLNVGVVRAGSRFNIVCPEAELLVEIRSTTDSGMRAATAALEEAASRPVVPGTRVTVEELASCPPMEDTAASRRMLGRAQDIGVRLGLTFGATATGGVGDANTIAGTGVPTLDGLGPVGGADHTPEEWLDVSTVPARVALLASLIADLGDGRSD